MAIVDFKKKKKQNRELCPTYGMCVCVQKQKAVFLAAWLGWLAGWKASLGSGAHLGRGWRPVFGTKGSHTSFPNKRDPSEGSISSGVPCMGLF